MIKTPLMIASLAALALAAPLGAQEQSRTKTYEGPNVSGTQTTTVNPETGTATRDREVTNLNTGKTATSSAERQRTETGSTIGVVQTGPNGGTRSLESERERTEGGSTFTGSATGRGAPASSATFTRPSPFSRRVSAALPAATTTPRLPFRPFCATSPDTTTSTPGCSAAAAAHRRPWAHTAAWRAAAAA